MRRRERGIALITAILVLLVLTALGIAASMMMTEEDRTSARMELQKAALYAAEAGLRDGEALIRNSGWGDIDLLLQHVAAAANPALRPPRPQHPVAGVLGSWNDRHLGTYLHRLDTGVELAGIEVPIHVESGSVSTGKRVFYSLYIRNNPEDAGGVLSNWDTRIRIVAAGWVTGPDATRPLAVKVLEEELSLGIPQSPSVQKQVNTGGTGSAVFGG
jgi:Tfp pilus assembly protein PilX